MKSYIFSFALLLSFVACQAQNDHGSAQVMSVSAFKTKIKQKSVQLIDVRTPEEYGAGHIEGALNIDVQSGDFESQVNAQISRKKPVAVYCRSGKRSARAASVLSTMGYKVVYDLKGGYLAWEAEK
ncbi:MAG: rhodanese-like domain-containing protein [Saprospiraceae bacterium]|jgi:rhodanese-related sulfurtransferase